MKATQSSARAARFSSSKQQASAAPICTALDRAIRVRATANRPPQRACARAESAALCLTGAVFTRPAALLELRVPPSPRRFSTSSRRLSAALDVHGRRSNPSRLFLARLAHSHAPFPQRAHHRPPAASCAHPPTDHTFTRTRQVLHWRAHLRRPRSRPVRLDIGGRAECSSRAARRLARDGVRRPRLLAAAARGQGVR